MSDESRLILDRYKDLLTLDVPRRSVVPAECHDADTSQHWRTRALRAEAALEDARAALRRATDPAPDDLLGVRLVNGCASLPDDTPAWVADLFREAWTAIRTLRADAATKAATIAAQDEEIERLGAQIERLKTRLEVVETERNQARDERDDLSEQIAAIRNWIDARTDAPRTDDSGAPLTLVQRLTATRAEFVRVQTERDIAEDLVSRAIANAGHHRTSPLWSHVMHLFGVGATRAQDLCRAHGYDPDQEVGPSQRPRRMT